mmetsp:Transcript_101250/g.253811  ORF Transcript_101250/g.253811 Transcript_101250/m.253811 type:complete len:249 (+) Transcript_101250:41-787(+)
MKAVRLLLTTGEALVVALVTHVAAESSLSSPEVLGISSVFFIESRSGSKPGFECNIGAPKGELPAISHSFGGGGGGEVWQHSGLFVSLGDHVHMQHRHVHRRAEQVAMRIQLTKIDMPFEEQPSTIYIGGLRESVHGPSHWEVHGKFVCPPQMCLMPRPEVEVDPTVMVLSKPHCGWAPPLNALTLTLSAHEREPSMEVDISHFLAQNVTVFKIWAAPLAVSEVGMWQTTRLSLKSLSLHRVPLETLV